jgi:hypothetical protein
MLVAFGSAASAAPAAAVAVPAEAPSTRPAKSAEGDVLNFSLLDYRGKYYELRRADARVPPPRSSLQKRRAVRR